MTVRARRRRATGDANVLHLAALTVACLLAPLLHRFHRPVRLRFTGHRLSGCVRQTNVASCVAAQLTPSCQQFGDVETQVTSCSD
jgi:hypothetical protein